ncbi:MAG: 4-diphosphocytidyl-2-C-methyl-D-erythritol kinase [Bacteroidetes bacterium]|nr:MAG: 4-diphosphocytidyl-2-C-methyl-D-erythritol kinase [Bacteroidota bacterium]
MIVFPNAKINVGLRVTGRRADGFHNIETVMIPVKLADALEVTPASDGLFAFTMSGIPVDGPEDLNLCVKAFRMMQKRYRLPEVKIHLHKVIPSGAGLGGGSSDAAFTLKLLNRLFLLKLCNNELAGMAAELGSDCPFFIENRPVLATGRGEVLSQVKADFSKWNIILVKPPVSVSTAWAYSHVKPSGLHLPGADEFPPDPSAWNGLFANDFEDAVFYKWPEIKDIRQSMMALGAKYASMSGSGSAVFGLFEKLPDTRGMFKDCFIWEGRSA